MRERYQWEAEAAPRRRGQWGLLTFFYRLPMRGTFALFGCVGLQSAISGAKMIVAWRLQLDWADGKGMILSHGPYGTEHVF